MVRLVFLILLQFLVLTLPGYASDTIKVKVVDQQGIPVQGVKVSIEGSEYFTTDARGDFKMLPAKTLNMPIRAKIIKEGYQMDELALLDSDTEIEITVKKIFDAAVVRETRLKILSDKGQAWSGAKVKIGKGNYISDREGFVTIRGELAGDVAVAVNGDDKTDIQYSEADSYYKVSLKKDVSSSVQQTTASNTSQVGKDQGRDAAGAGQMRAATTNNRLAVTGGDKPNLTEKQLNEIVYSQFIGDFDKISDALLEERKRLEESNEKIQEEINKITARLRDEKNLTKAQRKDLQAYLERLNSILRENSIAFHKSQEKTTFLIHKLQAALAQKDSINIATLKRAEKAEKERNITDRKFRRNLIVFSIITCALLILAVVFYAIAAKMKKQRKDLLKANEELQRIKQNMPHQMEENNV